MNIYIDSTMDDRGRRSELYNGSLFVHSPSPSSVKLCQLAQELIEEAFRPLDPLKAQESLPVERCVTILAELKPKFIHHPKSKEYIRGMLEDMRCDLDKTYFDVPRMRTAFPGDYLKSGIAYAFHPHRDTWYSAPSCQVNWWMPVYEIFAENSMAFHPRYWDEAVPNDSDKYNYYEWNRVSRKSAAQHIGSDTRVQPHALAPLAPDPQVRLVTRIGQTTLFSGAQLHSTVPNSCDTTRFSIDFRTVHVDDLKGRRGAPNLDSACTGTTIHDYLRGSDYSRLPDEVVALYADATEANYVASPSALSESVERK